MKDNGVPFTLFQPPHGSWIRIGNTRYMFCENLFLSLPDHRAPLGSFRIWRWANVFTRQGHRGWYTKIIDKDFCWKPCEPIKKAGPNHEI